MVRADARARLRPLRAALCAALLVLGSGVALAHATIVFGTLTTTPNPPRAGEPLTLLLDMSDPAQLPVEDAVVLAEFTAQGGGEGPEVEFEERAPGSYEARVTLDREGDYRLLLRDQTFRQEEARQVVTLPVGGEAPLQPIEFLFPPTATGSRNLGVWLVWAIGLPLLAGVVVTVLVLTGGRRDAPEAAGDPEDTENEQHTEGTTPAARGDRPDGGA